jgi:hypothetical protein
MKDFMVNAQHHAQQAMLEGAECYWITLTIPKGDMKPGEALRSLRKALEVVNRHKKFAGLGENMLGWIRVGEMGKQLSPHVHLLIFVRAGTTGVKKQVKEAWEAALAEVLGWTARPERLFNSVRRIPDLEAVKFKLDYLAKGDPYRSYTDQQKQAWEIATKGWQNLMTSRNWSLRHTNIQWARATRTPAGIASQPIESTAATEERLSPPPSEDALERPDGLDVAANECIPTT